MAKKKWQTMRPGTPSRQDMANFETAIFAAEIGSAEELDLHGLDTNLAISELEPFMHSAFMSGVEVVKIIHGRGNGILRTEIHKWLKKHPKLIAKYRDAENGSESGGVTYAALWRK